MTDLRNIVIRGTSQLLLVAHRLHANARILVKPNDRLVHTIRHFLATWSFSTARTRLGIICYREASRAYAELYNIA